MEEKIFDYVEKKLKLENTLEEIDIEKELALSESEGLVETMVLMKKTKNRLKSLENIKNINKRVILAPKELLGVFAKELLAAQSAKETDTYSTEFMEIQLDENSNFEIEIFNGGSQWIIALKDLETGKTINEDKKIKLSYILHGKSYSHIISFVQGYGEIKKSKFKEEFTIEENEKIILSLEEVEEQL